MHNPVTTAGAFVLLILIVGAAFVYVSANPVEIPKEPGLGVRGDDLTPAIAREMNLEQEEGFLVIWVKPDSPAERAGLMGCNRIADVEGEQRALGGDVITKVDDTQITEARDLGLFLDQKEIGDTVTLTIIRGSETLMKDVVLGERDPNEPPPTVTCVRP
jgi:S1-C subfamily serine protease